MERMNKAFDAAIEKDITFKQIRDAFLDPTGKVKVAGNDFYFPIEPVVGAKIAGRGLTYSTKLKAATVTRDFSQMGGYTQIVLGGSLRGPITYGLRLFGTRKPMGMVTFSGARPLDGTYELDSYFDNIAAFRNGSNFIKTSSTTKMKASEYRTYWKQQFLAAKDSGARFQLLEEFDKIFSRDMARTYGYYDIGKIDDFIAENHYLGILRLPSQNISSNRSFINKAISPYAIGYKFYLNVRAFGAATYSTLECLGIERYQKDYFFSATVADYIARSKNRKLNVYIGQLKLNFEADGFFMHMHGRTIVLPHKGILVSDVMVKKFGLKSKLKVVEDESKKAETLF
jgi:hypothetical protein